MNGDEQRSQPQIQLQSALGQRKKDSRWQRVRACREQWSQAGRRTLWSRLGYSAPPFPAPAHLLRDTAARYYCVCVFAGLMLAHD